LAYNFFKFSEIDVFIFKKQVTRNSTLIPIGCTTKTVALDKDYKQVELVSTL